MRLSWGALEHPGNDLEADSLCESGLEQASSLWGSRGFWEIDTQPWRWLWLEDFRQNPGDPQ